MPTAGRYCPNEAIAWTRYGIPGYCQFKCTTCGAPIKGPGFHGPFLCRRCLEELG